jgi:hypothetical protein
MMKQMVIAALIVFGAFSVQAQTTIKVFDSLLFFDGYAARVDSPAPPPGVIRHRNDLYARKLSAAELASIGSTLSMNVKISAACDNYDRIGNVNMAFVSKDSSSYIPANVKRIELGRYITPFMNKNLNPKTVPYNFNINNIALLLKDSSILNNYDVWIELEVFGVPYAANTQVAGCAGRKDVFYGSLSFTTNNAIPVQHQNVLIPLSFKKNFNNYQASATDTIGKTTRTFQFDVPTDLTDAAFFLITSNHGANSGGEEYNRRNHFVFYDGALKYLYKPGRLSCEPFRVYNTQGNGIYGSNPRSDVEWQSFSNWCPGDVIDIRRIDLGAVSAGEHKFMITVPNAVFANREGNFPLSVYLHGKKQGSLDQAEYVDTTVTPPADSSTNVKVYPNPSATFITVETQNPDAIRIIDMTGKLVYLNENPIQKTIINTMPFANGIYVIQVLKEGKSFQKKILVTH